MLGLIRQSGGLLMLLACVVLGVLACHDEPLAPARAQGPAPALASGPVTLAHASCTLTVTNGTGTIDCGTHGRHAPGVSAGATLYPFGPYVFVTPTHLVKDTVAQTWAFDATIQNLLGEPIGTLDGTTMLGVYSVITGLQVTSGSGTLSVANADGDSTFTAPNQPYFRYAQILASQQTSAVKAWRFNVPNTAKTINIDFVIVADFPAESNVAITPPRTKPDWFYDDSSWVNDGRMPDGFLKGIITVLFKTGTSLANRQLALAYVGGTVVGGTPRSDGDGYYYLAIPDDGTGAQLRQAVAKLSTLSQVEAAALQINSGPAYLRPHDGDGWQHWSLNPDSLSSGGTWAFEMIDAPYAWGCSTGDSSARVGIVDHGFDATEVADNVVWGRAELNHYVLGLHHGAEVSSVLAAAGDNDQYITGVMWHAGLMLGDAGSSSSTWKILPQDAMSNLDALGAAGASVVNLSLEINWTYTPSRDNPHDVALSDSVYNKLIRPVLLRMEAANHLPLIVIAAGNGSMDAFFSIYPRIHDDFPALVVGATRRDKSPLAVSNYGPYVDVYAPGANVTVLRKRFSDGAIEVRTDSGTSLAAPFVTGVVGLLKSFDPALSSDTLASLIRRGALNGGRFTLETHGGRLVPILNAYESLITIATMTSVPAHPA